MQKKNSSHVYTKRILFVVQHLGYLKHFENTIRFLSEQGSIVTVLYYKQKQHFSTGVIERIKKINNVDIIYLPQIINKSEEKFLTKLRRTIDSIQYKKSFYEDSPELKNRYKSVSVWKRDFPENIVEFLNNDLQLQEILTPTDQIRMLSKIFYQFLEPTEKIKKILGRIRPQTIIMSPFLDGDTEPYTFLKYGQEKNILTVYAMASWDNLQNKGVAKPAPDCYLVWTEDHKNQLIQIHDSEEKNIHVVGSEIFELWGKSKNQKSKSNISIDHKRVKILYCCSSPFISAGKEVELIISLVDKIASENLKDFTIEFTIKTHPQVPLVDLEILIKQNSSKYSFIKILKSDTNVNDDESSRAEFLRLVDEHDICLGINTSIMLEAAIQGLPTICISNFFQNLNFPKTLHEKFLKKYTVKTLNSMRDFEEFLENIENFQNSAEIIRADLQKDFSISKSSSVPMRVFNALTSAHQAHQENLLLKNLKIEHMALENVRNHKKNILKSLLRSLMTKATYTRTFQILQSNGVRSLVVHIQLFFQNQMKENHEFYNFEMSPLVLKKNKPSLLRIIDLSERKANTNLLNWDVLSSNFNNFKIKDSDTYSKMLEIAGFEIEELIGKYDNIVIGPWLSELGFELLYWVPYINKLFTDKIFINKQIITISRGGVQELYSFLPGKHLNLLEYYSPDDWFKITSSIWRDLGGLKQSKLVDQEIDILEKLKTESHFNRDSKTLVIHPSLMFSLFRSFWRNKSWSVDLISKQLDFPNFSKHQSENFGAVKIYSRPSLLINDTLAKKIQEFLVNQNIELKIITSDSYKDDHEVFVFNDIENSILVPVDEYENNLRLQFNVIKKSSVSYTTYGGLTYFALYFGKTSVGLFSDSSKFDEQHTKVAELLESKFGSRLVLHQVFP